MGYRTGMPTGTSRPVVVVFRRLPGPFDIAGAEVRLGGDHAPGRAELLRLVAGATVLVPWISERIDEEVLEAAGPGLRAVCNYAVGLDNIDLAACARRGVVVTNTPHAVTEGTADLTWALILAAARGLVVADRFARSEEYVRRGPLGPAEFLGRDLTGRTLLIVGAGRIGYAVALRSLGWGMRVLYVARTRHWEFELAPLAAQRVDLDQGLPQADVVSLHVPLTDQTRHLMDARRLALMKPTAILVNTARGPVIDESALAAALRQRRLCAAGLDVFEHEPRIHPDLLTLDNVVLTPHIGSAAERFRIMMTQMVRENVEAVLTGRPPPNLVPLPRNPG